MSKLLESLFFMSVLASVAMAEPQSKTPISSWTGFYTGVSLGAIFSESRLNASHNNFIDSSYREHLGSTDVLPGIQAGFNHQLSSGLVLGAEADFTYPDSTSEFSHTGLNGLTFDKFTFKNRLQGSIRSRIGYALGNLLPYASAGVSFADTSLRYDNEGSNVVTKNSVQTGWVLGAGLEYAFYRNFSLQTEYLYTGYGDPVSMRILNVINNIDPNGSAKGDLVSHSVRAALNYRF